MNVKWADVEGFEGLYLVSNCGWVWSMRRGKMLKPKIDRYGYYVVTLFNNGVRKYITVHRLVAQAFVPHPFGKDTVNHIDENKLNNRAENLEWVTVKENDNHGTRNTRMSQTKCKKPVMRILPDGTIQRFVGVKDASRKTGIAHSQIAKACKGLCNRQWAKEWRYA